MKTISTILLSVFILIPMSSYGNTFNILDIETMRREMPTHELCSAYKCRSPENIEKEFFEKYTDSTSKDILDTVLLCDFNGRVYNAYIFRNRNNYISFIKFMSFDNYSFMEYFADYLTIKTRLLNKIKPGDCSGEFSMQKSDFYDMIKLLPIKYGLRNIASSCNSWPEFKSITNSSMSTYRNIDIFASRIEIITKYNIRKIAREIVIDFR